MPAIRLADIPNAGPQALGPSNIGIGAPSVPRFAINPQVAQLTGAAALDPNALAGAAKQMQLDTYNINAFSGEAAGLANIGDALGDVSTVGFRFSQKMQDAKDTADLARAETVMRSAFQKQQNEQMNTPVDKWQERWAANKEQAKKALGEIGLSDKSTSSLATAWERWDVMGGLQIEGQANKQRIEGYQKDVTANAMMKAADEDYEGAVGIFKKAAADGIFSEAEANLGIAQIKDNIVRKAKEEKNANVASKTIGDPIAAERDLSEAILKGKPSELFPELTDKADQVRAYDAARAEATRYRQRLDDDALDMILTGQLSNEKDVRGFVGDALPEQQVLPLLKALSDTPVQREKALSMRPMVYAMADTYNPDNDDENRSEYFKIRDTIFQLPSDQREEPLALLRKARDEKADPTPLNVAKSQLKDLFDAGQFGSWEVGDDKKPKNEQEWNNYIEAGRKYAGHKSSLESWAKNNPREASSPDKVYDQFNRNLNYERQLQKFQKEKSRWRFPWEDAAPVAPPAPPINPDDVMQKIKSKSSLTPKATKKQIMDEVRRIDFDTPLPEMPS